MLKAKFLILLFSLVFIVSCSVKLNNTKNSNDQKFTIDYLSGGKNAFIFKNILKQQMIASNIFDKNSLTALSLEISADQKFQTTSITKIASRQLDKLTVTLKAYRKDESQCTFFQTVYKAEQSFLIVDSSANLSNTAAQNGIFLINSENISDKIVDDLLSKAKLDC